LNRYDRVENRPRVRGVVCVVSIRQRLAGLRRRGVVKQLKINNKQVDEKRIRKKKMIKWRTRVNFKMVMREIEIGAASCELL
jgi:hypothetical protein